jgi:hypothetical protein
VAAGIAVAVALTVGCGPPPTGTVSGTVTVDGQPVANGLITFLPDAGGEPQSAAIEGGKYATAAVPAGPCKVTVITRGANPAGGGGNAASGMVVGLGPGDVRPEPQAGGGKKKEVTVPARYADPTQSGLTFDVKPGANTKDFPLNS